MKSLMRSAALAGLLLIGGVSPGWATVTTKDWTSICGGSNFNTCASVSLSFDSETNAVTMFIQNLSGIAETYAGTVFTRIALFNVPDHVQAIVPSDKKVSEMSGPYRTSSGVPEKWGITNKPNSSGGGGALEFDMETGLNGIDNSIASACATDAELGLGGSQAVWMSTGCAPANQTISDVTKNDGWIKLKFFVSLDEMNGWDIAGTEIRIQGQNGPDGLSTQCITGPGGNCVPTNVVPEPMSMALLGTGLAGLAAVRRRRKSPELTGA